MGLGAKVLDAGGLQHVRVAVWQGLIHAPQAREVRPCVRAAVPRAIQRPDVPDWVNESEHGGGKLLSEELPPPDHEGTLSLCRWMQYDCGRAHKALSASC